MTTLAEIKAAVNGSQWSVIHYPDILVSAIVSDGMQIARCETMDDNANLQTAKTIVNMRGWLRLLLPIAEAAVKMGYPTGYGVELWRCVYCSGAEDDTGIIVHEPDCEWIALQMALKALEKDGAE